jgi:transcriptional regulator GlxA family with amidase domain
MHSDDVSENDESIDSSLGRLVRVPDPRFRRLALYVQTNMDKRLSLSQAAEIVGLERTYFSRAFRKVMGNTFSEWLCSARIEKARELLSLGPLTIMSVALSVGYRDLTTFERAFKRRNGMSPRRFRERYLVQR